MAITRYSFPEMRNIFEEENKLQLMLRVEAALVKAHATVGNIPETMAGKIVKEIKEKASIEYVKLKRVKEIEREINMTLWRW